MNDSIYGVLKGKNVMPVYDVLRNGRGLMTFGDIHRELPDMSYADVRSALMRLYNAGFALKAGRTYNGKVLWRCA